MLKNFYAIKCPPIDRGILLKKFRSYWLWNPGTLSFKPSDPCQPELATPNWLYCLDYKNNIDENGFQRSETYIVEGILNPLSREDKYKLITAYEYLSRHKGKNLILLDSHIDLPADLHPLIEIKEVPLPQGDMLRKLLIQYGKDSLSYQTGCLGLSIGEIKTIVPLAKTPEDVLTYKAKKLKGRGLQLAPEPDVPDIAGLDLLKKDLETIAALFQPTAGQIGLRPPKGMMLWGLPGTGKSLTAKLAAKLTGALLIMCDWNQLLGDSDAESLDNLSYVLNLVDLLGPTILAIDEFEKAISGSLEGGVTTKMVGKLLNWLEDHTTPVILLVTINHLSLLPPEMFRRFEYIWFFDNDLSEKSLYEIFNLHFKKRFPSWLENIFTTEEWENILVNYASYTPAEIGKVVKLAQTKLYVAIERQTSSKAVELVNNYPLTYPQKFYQLILEVQKEIQASISVPFLNQQLEQIRMYQGFARPVSRISPSKNFFNKNGQNYETALFS
ncbi:ATP-binding protein [Gloeothece verrucosa]|uniref:Uncharacterized AAA domain-containing protein ycf46 n=1 Tax=Gloeothece verrucosa (strain PCC 7822) TaxID=497965 RepID=E0UMB2_GLOV7|nr:AAA family ATPase [Gloeothece verrucosa]ADN18092.1 AAA ATPase central domain protein [Gloeothece verrucosa PCC 7822]